MLQNITKLASNPNALALADIDRLVSSGATTPDELKRVLPGAVVDSIGRLAAVAPLPEAPVTPLPTDAADHCREEDFTLVYFWGLKGCGKTTVVSALLSAGDDVSVCPSTVSERSQRMAQLFMVKSPEGLSCIPTDDCSRRINITHVVARHQGAYGKRRYPLSFIECDIDEANEPWGYKMDGPNDKIHIFCLDCSGDVSRQARLFDNLLTRLDRTGVLATSVGIYVLVTKTDTMLRVPRAYRDKAAQTLVTAGQRHLWRHVVNCCYRLNILDATPIAFSIGDVALQHAFTPDPTAARRLWERPLLLKSQSLQNTTGRILRSGNEWLTTLLFTVAVILGAYGIGSALSINAPCPTEQIQPVDFGQRLQHHISATMDRRDGYRKAMKVYKTLDADIDRAAKTAKRDGTMLIDADQKAECRATLDEVYAPIINDAVSNLFAQPNWNHAANFHELDAASLALYKRSERSKAIIRDNRLHFKTYFERIAPALSVSSYTTLEAVMDADKVYDTYHGTFPFSNLAELRGLSNKAHQSYKAYLKAIEPSFIHDPWGYFSARSDHKQLVSAYERYLDSRK